MQLYTGCPKKMWIQAFIFLGDPLPPGLGWSPPPDGRGELLHEEAATGKEQSDVQILGKMH